jgi:hypothetical protein
MSKFLNTTWQDRSEKADTYKFIHVDRLWGKFLRTVITVVKQKRTK